jgi:hypothetical protein
MSVIQEIHARIREIDSKLTEAREDSANMKSTASLNEIFRIKMHRAHTNALTDELNALFEILEQAEANKHAITLEALQ